MIRRATLVWVMMNVSRVVVAMRTWTRPVVRQVGPHAWFGGLLESTSSGLTVKTMLVMTAQSAVLCFERISSRLPRMMRPLVMLVPRSPLVLLVTPAA